jgi:SAM-dependent methyltransferase
VGCGSGEFLLAMQQIRWRAFGIDVNEHPVRLARERGVPAAVCADFLAYRRLDSLDVITFNHVLEHVPAVGAYLDHAAKLLKPDGLLLISVPNFNSLSRRVFGRYWTHLDLPRHVFHFTPMTLRCLVEARSFEVVCVSQSLRQDNALGVRESLRRWVRLGLLRHSDAGRLGSNRGQRPSSISLLRRVYDQFGNLVAAATERLGVADTFILVARCVKPTELA